MTKLVTTLSLLTALTAFTAACNGSSGGSPTTPTSTDTAAYSSTDLRVGNGATAVAGQRVTVNYTGWLYSASASENKGNTFDSGRGTSFQLGTLIACWNQGIPGMRVGGLRRLVCPPNVAYGSSSPGAGIPANATLLFEVELVSVP
ncbi:MAG: FKBP-type peptidyl-prolyl cis-trans isomerase [Acidobacteria bacterium]|jgi:FKBP-type peptidyl-prolyl cis-trans isomerase FkpA|nr:FKBP-type peptidyl-prolyl cis-trans isomerase [Acidobacteriota bacterium]